MNLLFYAPALAPYGGMERHVCALAAMAAGRGHTVTLLTTGNSLGDDLRAELNHPRITLRELPAARGHAGRWRKLAWLLREVADLRRQSWDLVYTNGQSALAGVVWRAARGSGRIVHHHHTAADPAEQATWSPWFRQVLQRTPELVACSRATRDALADAARRDDVHYLPYLTRCPVDGDAVMDRAAGTALHFGFMGRLIPEKGIDALCRQSAHPALAEITWHIHGAGPAYPPEFFRRWPRVAYHGSYAGATAQRGALLALDAVVLFSTHNEGMPLGLIEAMSAGLPWVAVDRGGIRELALSPADTIVVPAPADDDVLRTAVAALAARIRSGATSRARQRAVYDAHFAPDAAGARWFTYLEGGNPRRGDAPPVLIDPARLPL